MLKILIIVLACMGTWFCTDTIAAMLHATANFLVWAKPQIQALIHHVQALMA